MPKIRVVFYQETTGSPRSSSGWTPCRPKLRTNVESRSSDYKPWATNCGDRKPTSSGMAFMNSVSGCKESITESCISFTGKSPQS